MDILDDMGLFLKWTTPLSYVKAVQNCNLLTAGAPTPCWLKDSEHNKSKASEENRS